MARFVIIKGYLVLTRVFSHIAGTSTAGWSFETALIIP